ncbi:hypothetical protein ACX0G9_23730 [Flavitalea flava]
MIISYSILWHPDGILPGVETSNSIKKQKHSIMNKKQTENRVLAAAFAAHPLILTVHPGIMPFNVLYIA